MQSGADKSDFEIIYDHLKQGERIYPGRRMTREQFDVVWKMMEENRQRLAWCLTQPPPASKVEVIEEEPTKRQLWLDRLRLR